MPKSDAGERPTPVVLAPWWFDVGLIALACAALAWLGRRGPVSPWAQELVGIVVLVSAAHLGYGLWRAVRARRRPGAPEA